MIPIITFLNLQIILGFTSWLWSCYQIFKANCFFVWFVHHITMFTTCSSLHVILEFNIISRVIFFNFVTSCIMFQPSVTFCHSIPLFLSSFVCIPCNLRIPVGKNFIINIPFKIIGLVQCKKYGSGFSPN